MTYRIMLTKHETLEELRGDLDDNGKRGVFSRTKIHRHTFKPWWATQYLECCGVEGAYYSKLYALPALTQADNNTIMLLKLVCPEKIVTIFQPMTLDAFSDCVYTANKTLQLNVVSIKQGRLPAQFHGLIPHI